MNRIKRSILFTFCDNFELCKNRINLLRFFNPNTEIYGLCSRTPDNHFKFKDLDLNHLWCWKHPKDYLWGWKHNDLLINRWYREIGHTFSFDMLHVIERDMLLLQSLDSYFKDDTDSISLSALTPIEKLNDWYWTSGSQQSDWLKTKEEVVKKFGYNQSPFACIGCGMSLSRKFLDLYSKETPLEVGCCEYQIPLYAQCFNIPIRDTGMHGKYFSVTDNLISETDVINAYNSGIVAFHPMKTHLNKEKLRLRNG